MNILPHLILILLGMIMGLSSSILGIGGGVLILPILYNLYPDVHPLSFISTSLAIIFLNAINNVYHYKKSGLYLDIKSTSKIGCSAFIGALTSLYLAQFFEQKQLKQIFVVILFAALIKLIYPTKAKKEDPIDFEFKKIDASFIKLIISGLLGGFVAGMTGLGGGIVFIPLFLTSLSIPAQYVVMYSQSTVIFGTFAAIIYSIFISSNSNTAIQWSMVFPITVGSYMIIPFGVKIARKIPIHYLKSILVGLLLILGSKIGYENFSFLRYFF